MPGKVYSALNTGGTPYETAADTQANRNADWMLQQAMMQQRAQQFQASLADRQNDRLAQRDIQGTYAQRAAGDRDLAGIQGEYGLEGTRLQGANQQAVAGIQYGASNKLADLQVRQYGDQAPLMQAQNAAKLAALQRQQQLQAEIFKDVQGGSAGFTGIDPRARQKIQTAAYAKAAGLDGDFNASDQGDQLVTAYLNSRISDPNVNPNDIPAFIDAARSRDISHLPMQRRSVESAVANAPEIGLQSDVLESSAGKLGSFDANPQRTVGLAKSMVDALVAKGVSPGEAKTSVTRSLIAKGLLPEEEGAIARFLKGLGYTAALGGLAGPLTAPAVDSIPNASRDAAPLRDYLGYNP